MRNRTRQLKKAQPGSAEEVDDHTISMKKNFRYVGANNEWPFGIRFCCRIQGPDWIHSQYSWEDGDDLELDWKTKIYTKGSISFPLICSAATEDLNATSTFFFCHSKVRPQRATFECNSSSSLLSSFDQACNRCCTPLCWTVLSQGFYYTFWQADAIFAAKSHFYFSGQSCTLHRRRTMQSTDWSGWRDK